MIIFIFKYIIKRNFFFFIETNLNKKEDIIQIPLIDKENNKKIKIPNASKRKKNVLYLPNLVISDKLNKSSTRT